MGPKIVIFPSLVEVLCKELQEETAVPDGDLAVVRTWKFSNC
jgi:hypothetical protein